jgi:hypothetical protein
MVGEKNSLNYLVIDGTHTDEELVKAWKNIEIEVLRERLKDKDFKSKQDADADLALSKIRAARSNNPYSGHLIKLRDIEKESKEEGGSLYDLLAVMTRKLQIQINEKQMCVRLFLAHLKSLKDG